MSLTELRSQVVSALREAAEDHAQGRFDRISSAYDQLAAAASQAEDLDTDLQVAIHFLDGWYDSSNHAWAFYEPITCDDWPRLGLQLALDLEAGTPIDANLRERFTFAARRGLWSLLRSRFKGSA